MRQIYVTNCTQVVVSAAHPEGMFSVMSGYPKYFDSRNYDGDTEKALRLAKSDYLARLSAIYAADNRAMATVTLERADGKQIMRESIGAFPEEPTPEPEEEVVENEAE